MKALIWISSSKKDLEKLPEGVREIFEFGLRLAQQGQKHIIGKPLKGFGGASVIELVEKDPSGTYRAVYTTKMPKAVFVVACISKKV